GLSHVLEMSDQSSLILLVGLAVGVDYSLFYLRREREERAKGADPATALQTAAATSGNAVLISGLTVIIAISGMLMTGNLDVTAPAVQHGIAQLRTKAAHDPQVVGGISQEINHDHTVTRLDVGLPGEPSSSRAQDALKHLREDLLPSTIRQVDGVSANVTGGA